MHNMINIVAPENPLAPGSLRVQSHDKSLELEYFKKMAEHHQGPYMIYSKNTLSHPEAIKESHFVPYPKTGWWLWNQIKILWNITFGAPFFSYRNSHPFLKKCGEILAQPFKATTVEKMASTATDFFCKQDVIDRQLVLEGKKVNVLYDTSPIAIGKEKLHFLIVPKRHCVTLEDLTQEEYKEVEDLIDRITHVYSNKKYATIYRFNKNGHDDAERKRAGQTVPHWHEHVIITATKTEEFWGKWMVLKGMLWGRTKLSDQEYQTRIKNLRDELA